jgi:glutathione S-transferase
MRLFTFERSPNPLKVRLALAELELPYERVEVDLFKREHLTPAFAEVTPLQAVPVLEDGDLRLRESNAILLYLSAKQGDPGWAGDERRRALAHQWLFFESATLAHNCGVLWWSEVVAPKLGFPCWEEDDLAEAADDLGDALPALDAHLATNRFMLGDAHTVVDCSLGVILSMLRGTRLADCAAWPHVSRYVHEVRARPSWAAARGDAIHTLA